MDPRAIAKANHRLRIARKAFDDLKASRNYGDFSDYWYIFLTSAKSVYTVLEQGAKISPQSRQWFGSKANIRRNDELLQYLYEARNDDEHGLDSSINFCPERHDIGIRKDGFSDAVLLDGGGFKNVVVVGCGTAISYSGMQPPADLNVSSLDGKPVLRKQSAATAILVDVRARGDRILKPPTSHLGNQIAENSPLSVAGHALAYLETLVSEASALA